MPTSGGAFGTRLLLLLNGQGIITPEQASACTASGLPILEEHLIMEGWATRKQLAEVLAQSFQMTAAPEEFEVDTSLVPATFMVQNRILCLSYTDTEVTLAAQAPPSPQFQKQLADVLRRRAVFVITDRVTLRDKLAELERVQTTQPSEVQAAVPTPAPSAQPVPPVQTPAPVANQAPKLEASDPFAEVLTLDKERAEAQADPFAPEVQVIEEPGPTEVLPSKEKPESTVGRSEPVAEVPQPVAEAHQPVVEASEPVAKPAPSKPVETEPVSPAAMETTQVVKTSGLMAGLPQLGVAERVGGRYLLGEQLLDGRFSVLYRGQDQKTGLPVTIRHLQNYLTSAEARMQTLREGRTLSRLRHVSLPKIRDLVQHEGDIYLIADGMPGRTLEEVVTEKGAFEPELVRRYLIQLLQVVRFFHSRPTPIIHRDLRPGSLLVSPHGNLRVAEFGLAKMGEAAAASGNTSFRSTGNPNFAAPEQLMGDVSTPLNDLYSVGALGYFMATGQLPTESLKRFAGDSSMGALPSSIDWSVREVIQRCLAPKPEERATSAKELLKELEVTEIRLPMRLLEMAEASQIEAEINESSEDSSVDSPAQESPQTSQVDSPTEEPEVAAPPKKRSMWQLLFGSKTDTKEVVVSDDNTETKQEQLEQFPMVDLAAMEMNREVGRTLPESLCRTIGGLCIGRLSDKEVTVVCKDPTDVFIYDQVAVATGGKFTPTLMRGDENLIEHALEFIFRSDHLGPETGWSKFLELKRLDGTEITTTNEQAAITFGDEALEGPIVNAVDRLIKEAIAAEASDIHLEPYETGMDIRYRVDGVLRVVAHHGRQEAGAIVKRLKVMANMDIAQERITQGGRISLKVGTAEFDLRVSIVPVPIGESVVMRILKKGAFTLTLGDLGFSEAKETKFRQILSQPHGMILVCGPTGSGKSTTLYASLKEIQRPDRKLITAEDPIEYQMPGIIQVQMNTAPREEEKKVTFSKALREFLRQDPDVILVGEIRDQETAEIGIQAALTGHLLLSTLHTNDSIGIVARLRDMECEPFQIGSVLLGGLAQRLARKICQECKEPAEIPEQFLELFAEHGIKEPRAFKGKGCRKCHKTGHKGRVGLYELLEVTPEVRALINRAAAEEEIRKVATSQGFKDLLSDGLEKVCEGKVSLEEVLRVCKTI